MRFVSQPCKPCGCVAEAETKPIVIGGETTTAYDWTPPDPMCECECHFEWHFINSTPGAKRVAA